MTTDFRALAKEARHAPHNVLVFVEASLLESPVMDEKHQVFKSILEFHAFRITGLRTGKSLRARQQTDDPAKKELFTKNMTTEVRITFHEARGRQFEPIIAELMELHCTYPTRDAVNVMFVEPDATGTQAVAVWRGSMTPLSSGESDAYRDLSQAQSSEAILEVPFATNLRYNNSVDRVIAQKHLDALNANGLNKPRGDVADTQGAILDRAMEKLAAVAAAQPNTAMPMQIVRIDVITHNDCLDGIAAAWVVKSFYEGKNRQDLVSPRFDVHVHYADYHQVLPELPPRANVFMTDFCPNDIEELKALLKSCQTLKLIDHHPKTRAVIDQLKEWVQEEHLMDRFDAEFSEHKSGALLAWDYLMTGEAPPIIQAVSDRDLWQFKLPYTEPLCEALMAYGLTLEGFDDCMRSVAVETLIERGKILIRSKEAEVDWLIQNTVCVLQSDIDPVTDRFASSHGKLRLLAVNGNKPIASRVCETLEKRYPGYAGYVCYWDMDGGAQRYYSVRSQEGYARIIARHYGGEGHNKAAGFTLSQNEALVVDLFNSETIASQS